jgi:hypothetical protein
MDPAKTYKLTVGDLVAQMCKAEGWTSTQDGTSWEIEIPQPKERKQKVSASGFQDGADPMVRYLSKIGGVDKIDDQRTRMALELNSKLPHGCLAIEGGFLVFTETRPLRTTTPESSAVAVRYLAKQADMYERLIYGEDAH